MALPVVFLENIMKNKTDQNLQFMKGVSVIILLSCCLVSMNCRVVNTTQKANEVSLFNGSQWYYRFYSWQKQKNMETIYYSSSDNERNVLPQNQETVVIGPKNDDHKFNTNTSQTQTNNKTDVIPKKSALQPPKKRIPGAIIHASLTGTPGSIAISGNRYQVNIQIDGHAMDEENFITAASSGFIILAEGNGIKKKFQVNSPSFGTNMIIHSLTLSINPLNNTASISGKLNLDLPGTMSGSLINLSNGTSSSCEVQKGYFSTAVPLSEGMNQLTAIGKWLTITLELPSISVLVQS